MSALETLGNDVEEALEHLNVPSYVLDTHGIIRWVNPAGLRLVGDVRGKLFTSVVAPEEKSRAQAEFAKKVYGTAKTTDADVVRRRRGRQPRDGRGPLGPATRGDRVVGVFGQLEHEPMSEPVTALAALTPRQTEVLRLLEHGRSTQQIADELHLSRETVRNHIRHILQGARSPLAPRGGGACTPRASRGNWLLSRSGRPQLLPLRPDRPQPLAEAGPRPRLDLLVPNCCLTPRRGEVFEPGVGFLDQQQLARFSSRRRHRRNHPFLAVGRRC